MLEKDKQIARTCWMRGAYLVMLTAHCVGTRMRNKGTGIRGVGYAAEETVTSISQEANQTGANQFTNIVFSTQIADDDSGFDSCIMFQRLNGDMNVDRFGNIMTLVSYYAPGSTRPQGPLFYQATSNDRYKPFCVKQEKKVAEGANAFIYSGLTQDSPSDIPPLLAVKIPKQNDTGKFQNEVDALEHVRSENDHIVRLFGYNDVTQSLAMEMLTGESLQKIREQRPGLFPLNASNAKKVVGQVVDAIIACHKHNVAHRDLKEEQFVFEKPILTAGGENWDTPLKLVDFGEAMRLNGVDANFVQPWRGMQWSDKVGSYDYLSPEAAWNGVFNGFDGDLKQFSLFAPDVWAVGVITFQVVTGKIFLEEVYKHMETRKPIHERRDLSSSTPVLSLMHRLIDATDEDIKSIIFSFVDQDQPKIRSFLEVCLKIDPATRAFSYRLREHPWLVSLGRSWLSTLYPGTL